MLLNDDIINQLKSKSVAIIGVGGLGGYVSSLLARLPLAKLVLVDGDIFQQSNINRQIFCNQSTLGQSKSHTAYEVLSKIGIVNTIISIQERLDANNYETILQNIDLIVDCTDNIPSRLIIETASNALNIPIIHGAISGMYGQITTIIPPSNTLSQLYKGVSALTGQTIASTPSIVASFQANECTKLLINNGELLTNKLLTIDCATNEIRILNL